MIQRRIVENWKDNAPWLEDKMVEQDPILSRAIVCLFDSEVVRKDLIFRGGTSLNKLFFDPPARYSEDLDFVQRESKGVGPTIYAIRMALKGWLDLFPKSRLTNRGAKLIYKFETVDGEVGKLKIEINTTEHFQVLPTIEKQHTVESEWFSGKAIVPVYQLEELIATKIRALYQRRKGRDLFDLWDVLCNQKIDIEKTMDIFREYNKRCESGITSKLFQTSLEEKLEHPDFLSDMERLLPMGSRWNEAEAKELIFDLVLTII